jgi:hypothetical protein
MEVVHAVAAHGHAGAARPLRGEGHARFAFQHAVDIAAIRGAIESLRHVIPAAQRVQPGWIDQHLGIARPFDEGIEIPGISDHADFEQDARFRRAAGLIIACQMQPALLERAAIGAEQRLRREPCRPGQGMARQDQRILHTIEHQRLAQRALHLRMAQHLRRHVADARQIVEAPQGLPRFHAGGQQHQRQSARDRPAFQHDHVVALRHFGRVAHDPQAQARPGALGQRQRDRGGARCQVVGAGNRNRRTGQHCPRPSPGATRQRARPRCPGCARAHAELRPGG